MIYEELDRFLLFNEMPELEEPMKNFKEKKIVYKNISKNYLDEDIPFLNEIKIKPTLIGVKQ